MDTTTNTENNNNNLENTIKREDNIEKQQHEAIKEESNFVREDSFHKEHNNKITTTTTTVRENGYNSHSQQQNNNIKLETTPSTTASTSLNNKPPTIHGTTITTAMLSGIIGSVSNMNSIQYNNSESTWGSRSVESHDKIEQIGEGTFGQVYKARSRDKKEIVALKKVIMDNEVEGFPITAIREIKILKELNHANVVELKEVVTSKANAANNHRGSVYMVFEYMDHDLNGLMDSPAFKYFTPAQIKCYLKQLLEGLDYCHRNNVLHRDIKGSNLLLDNNGILKLADFGLARTFNSSEKRQLTNRVITLWYRPPELLLGAEHYGPEIDMWSVGCIMAELLSKKTLFPGRNAIDQLDKIYHICGSPSTQSWPEAMELPFWETLKPKREYNRTLKEFYQHETSFSKEAFELLDKLLCMDPKKRITASEALDSQYFWTEPMPCNPKDLPQYPSCHEYRTKKRLRQNAAQQNQNQSNQNQNPQQQQQQNQHHNQQQQGANVNHHQNHHHHNQQSYNSHQQHNQSYQNGMNNQNNQNYKKQRTEFNPQQNPQQSLPYNKGAPYGGSQPPLNQQQPPPPPGGYMNGNGYPPNNRSSQQQHHGAGGNRPPQNKPNNNFPLNNNNRNSNPNHR